MKGKKLAFAVILALIVCLVLIPVSAYAEESTGDPVPLTTGDPVVASDPGSGASASTPDPDVPQPPTAEEETAIIDDGNVVEVDSETELEDAVTDVATDTIVEVTDDITVPSSSTGGAAPISVAAKDNETVIVIDLGGNSVSAATSSNTSTNVFSFEKGKITVRNGTINGNIRVKLNASVYLDPTLTVNGFVLAYGDNGQTENKGADPKLNVDCIVNNSTNAAVMTNGSCSGGKITISENAQLTSTSPVGCGMYLPGNAKVTVNGGSITGKTGIYMKAGTLVMNGGTVTATGEKNPYKYDSSGYNPTGDGIFVDYAAGYKGILELAVNGGNVASENGEAVVAYKDSKNGNDQTEGENVQVTGGVFSDDSALEYVADGNVVVKVGEQYGVNAGAFVLGDIAAENGEVIEILAAPAGMSIDGVIPGVTFVNKSDNDVFVNGVKIAAGETYTVPGAEFTYTEAYTAKYFVVDGEEQEWTKGSADGLTFKLNSEDVIKVLIDGVEVEFTVENGKIVISAEVLEALEAGEHEIEFVFADGSCKTVFTVK